MPSSRSGSRSSRVGSSRYAPGGFRHTRRTPFVGPESIGAQRLQRWPQGWSRGVLSVNFPYASKEPSQPTRVRLTGLALRGFRNLGRQELVIPREGAALVGDNAQGKSSFLEAIYYLETFRSFRGARDDQLVSFDEPVFRVGGTVESGGEGDAISEITAAFAREGKRKKVTVDGNEPDRLGDAIGRL